MSYGTIKVDTITFTDNSVDKSVSLSGLIQNPTFTGNITVTGTISGDVIRGGTTVSGATVTGTTVLATTGAFTSLTGTTIQGTTATYTTGSFTSLTGTTIQGTTATYTTGSFTSLTGTTVTGTTASFTSGVFTNISGTTTTITSGIIASGTAAAPSLAILADLDTGLFSPGANQLAVATNGTGRLFVDATGNVGIGANPSSLLWVRGGAATATISSSTNTSNLDLVNSSQTTRLGAINADFSIAHAGSERLRITSAGLVGVGTSSPQGKLHVVGDSATPGVGNINISNGAYPTSGWALRIPDSGSTIDLSLDGAVAGTFRSVMYFARATGNVGIGTSVPGALLNLQGTFGTSLTTGLRIDGLGSTTNNVSPIAFYIQSSNWGTQHAANIACGTLTGLDGGGYLRFSTSPDGNTAPAERLRITATGLVGIGTASPSQLLHLQGSDIGIFVKNTNSSGTSRLLFGNDLVSEAQIFYNGSTKSSFGGNGALTIYHGGNKPILFATANTERIRIDGSGRLLVGTSAGYGVASSGLARFQVGSTAADIHASLTDWSNLNQGGVIAFGAARGGAVGDYTIVQDGDNLGSIRFAGADGTDLQSQGASIAAQVDGTPGANDMPGRLTFSTTADGASTPTERLRITSAGLVGIGLSTDIGATLHVDPSTNVTAGFGAPLIKVGGANSWGSTGSLYSIGFGYNNGSTVKSPAEIGLATTSTAGVTKGDLVFATRDVTTDTAPIERLRIDSSGRLLVGTSTSPSSGNGQFAPLVVQGYIGGSTSLAYLSLQRGEAASSITADEGLGAITFGDNAGNTFAQVAVAADGTAGSGDYPGRLTFSTTADGASTPTERMRITNGGSILCDSTTIIGGDTAPLQADGKTRTALALKGGSNGFFAAFYNTSSTLIGSITGAGGATTFYNTSSDYRIKENVVPLTEAISRVNQLQVHRFNFISHPDQTVDGFIAHEAQEVVPECVTGTKDAVDADGNPVMQGIDQSKLVPLLTAALQEAIGEIESLKARVTALES
jgi:hypothetical protein